MGRFLCTSAALACASLLRPGGVAAEPRVHVVEAGESLWTIARAHGCDVSSLTRENRLAGDHIRPGQRLEIPACAREADPPPGAGAGPARPRGGAGATTPTSHVVASGESLWVIARRYQTTVAELRFQNGLANDRIYAGQRLEIVPGSGGIGKIVFGQSLGRPHAGRLVRSVRMPAGGGYLIRRPQYSFGTNHSIYHVQRAINTVRGRYPHLHVLAVGDLSARRGGRIPRHNSHQSGRDVDLGFYFKKKPRNYPKDFATATADNLHFAATWLLVESLASTADANGGVERIFLGYRTQKLLYDWARKNGVPKRRLDRLFQYPRGQWASHGIIRHEPGHEDHLHVRFKCPDGDPGCL